MVGVSLRRWPIARLPRHAFEHREVTHRDRPHQAQRLLTVMSDVNVARLEGKPVGMVYPDANGMGTLIIPNCAVLITGGPHPDVGRRFIDYLLRPETEKVLAESEAAQIPLRPGIPVPEVVPSIERLKPMAVDYTALASLLETLSGGYLKNWVARQSR